jgi:hypothetical protein
MTSRPSYASLHPAFDGARYQGLRTLSVCRLMGFVTRWGARVPAHGVVERVLVHDGTITVDADCHGMLLVGYPLAWYPQAV